MTLNQIILLEFSLYLITVGGLIGWFKKKNNMETLIVRAKHFKDVAFLGCDCALDKAAKDQYKTSQVSEWVKGITIDSKTFFHSDYGVSAFDSDYKLAIKAGFDDTVIRKVILRKAKQLKK